MKKCKRCGQIKPFDEFYNSPITLDRKAVNCIPCSAIMSHEWYMKNKEKRLAKGKEWRENNSERIIELNKKWYEVNKQKKLRQNREYEIKRMAKDPSYRLLKNLRHRINDFIDGSVKSAKTLDLLGCPYDFFMKYMEEQFRDGMTWKNYGKLWHVDHIIPCSNFDLLLIDEQKKCFHYSNLQPLLAKENMAKSNKIN